jgi:hypothetical protein
MQELLSYLFNWWREVDINIGDMLIANDTPRMLHYIWPEGIALSLFLMGLDIYLHRTKKNRVHAKIAGLLFNEKEKRFSIVCEYETAHGDRRHVMLHSTQWQGVATGTPIDVDISEDTPTVGSGVNEYMMTWAAIGILPMLFTAAWRDISAPHFSFMDFVTQLATSEAVLLGIVLILTPLKRLLIHVDVNRLHERLSDMVRFEDLAADDPRRPIFAATAKRYRRTAFWVYAFAILATFMAAISCGALARAPFEATVVAIKTRTQTYRPDVEDKDRSVTCYYVAAQAGGSSYLLQTGLSRPPYAAGDKVRLRYTGLGSSADFDEGIVAAFLLAVMWATWSALAFFIARRARRMPATL